MSRRILILTHNLNPGKDGVGDYCRTLGELIRQQGHSCDCIALQEDIPQDITELNVERWSSQTPLWRRLHRLRQRIAMYDRVSLQLSPYGWHPQGILRTLLNELQAQDITVHNVHIHELWIGWNPQCTWKHRILGAVQKYYFKKLLNRTQTITTSNDCYGQILRDNKYDVSVHPLLGYPELYAVTHPLAKEPDSTVFVLWGALHPEWWDLATLQKLFACYKKPILIQLGLARNDAVLKNLSQLNIPLQLLGELPAGSISNILQQADIGISTNPPELLGKSSTTTGMLEHGLPVVVTRPPLLNKPVVLPNNVFTVETISQGKKIAPQSQRIQIVSDWLCTIGLI